MGLYEIARSAFAGWVNDARRKHWGVWVDAFSLTVDALSELADLARAAALPGQVDSTIAPNFGGYLSTDALRRYIADDRMVVPGLAESADALALRCRRYRDDWRVAGDPFAILDQLAGVLSSPGQAAPLLRIVVRGTRYSGEAIAGSTTRWFTRHPDGTIRLQTGTADGFYLAPDGTSGTDDTTAHGWNWDDTTDPAPPDQSDDTRFWVIVYWPAAQPYLTATDGIATDPGLVRDGWNDPYQAIYGGSPWAGTCGTNAPIALVESVRAVIRQRRVAGFRCAYIIVTSDLTAFNPDGTSTGDPEAYPSGKWGHMTKFDSGSNSRVLARLRTAEYWPAEPGGKTLT